MSMWVKADTLRAAQKNPEEHQNLIVRVAGYSDYFNNLNKALQDEIISRTEQNTLYLIEFQQNTIL